ncbi:MAG: MBL fold metallo-hydrolase [Desulfocucumaceae bacterium]
MEIKWFGTAAISISEDNETILFDPFISMNSGLKSFSAGDFASAGSILITHGHFDHLKDVPGVIEKGGARVYCSKLTASILKRDGVDAERIVTVSPGDLFKIGLFSVRVMKGKHIVFDRKLLFRTFINPRMLFYFGNLRKILRDTGKYPEGEVLVYEIEVKGKKILHMGSLNMDEKEIYPQAVDVMTIPFQGRSDLDHYALQFVQRVKPQNVYLHHFDDSFPPVSSRVNTNKFCESVKKIFPGIGVVVPGHGETISF